MPLRRLRAASAAAVLLAVPLLSSCGFDPGTNQVNTPQGAPLTQSDEVDVLSSVIVSSGPGAGTYVASINNRSQTEPLVLDSVLGGEGNAVQSSDFEPVEIAAGYFVNLADDQYGIGITGQFGAGDVVPLTLGFADGDSISVRAIVVRACEEYAGLDTATEPPAASPTSASPTEESSGAASGAGEEETVPASPAASTEPEVGEEQLTTEEYSCDLAETEPEE